MKKKAVISMLLALIFCGACACNQPEDALPAVEVWTATGTEKLMRDMDYSARYGQDTLTIKAFRNEHESAQIMISSQGNYDYEVMASDLKNANGETLSADAFTLYHQKYINVTKIRDNNSPTSMGYYPDALIPMENAKAYGETKLTGKNQGVWVTLKAPKDQPAGDYQGSFTVKVNGETHQVPVKVTVYDYTLDDEVHSKSSFSIGYEYLGWGELDTSVEMQEAYYEALLEYRLNGQHLPGNEMVYVRPEGEPLERFLYYADKYSRDPRCSTYNLPFTLTTAVYNGATIQSVDFEQFAILLRKMAQYSVENGVNLLKKASTYFIFFDEYDLHGTTETANYNLNKATEVCNAVVDELQGTLVCEDEALRQEIIACIAGIKHKVVGNLTDGLQVQQATSVPLISKYHTEEGRALYRDFAYECYGDDAELWAYTCLEPRTPYPTYHIEDILMSSRLLGWMMYDYDIVGNLYWEVTLYAWRQAAFGDYQLQDYYDTAARYPAANGDGFLFYPGRDYGVYGPIGTLRVQSIRDGNEDYDLMYALEQAYARYGVTESEFDGLYSLMTDKLYSGTMVRIRDGLTDYFDQSRTLLAELLQLAYNTGTVIKNIAQVDGKTVVTLLADEGVQLTAGGGVALQQGATQDGKVEYVATVEMTQEANYLSLTAVKGDQTASLSVNLGGRSSIFNAASLISGAQMVSAGEISVDTIEGASALKLAYAASERQIAQIDVSTLGVDEKTGNVTINVYSYGDKAIDLKILSKCERSQSFIESGKLTLNKGWNKITIPITAFNCANYGKLTTLRFNLAETEATQIAVGNLEIGG